MKNELELRHLRVFTAVVEAETLTLAAQSLGLAQSTVSESIASLERALGSRVLVKNGRRVSLTAEGRTFVRYAEKMLTLQREAKAALGAITQRASETLVIGTVESVSAYVLPAALSTMRQARRKVRVDVETASCVEIRRRVKDGELDLGIVLEGERPRRAKDRVLARAPLVLFRVGRGSAHGAKNHDGAIPSNASLFFSDRSGLYHQLLRQHFRASGFPTPAMTGVGTIEAVKRIVSKGANAYGVLPLFAIIDELRSRHYTALDLAPPLGRLVLRAVTSSQSASRDTVIEEVLSRTEQAARTLTQEPR